MSKKEKFAIALYFVKNDSDLSIIGLRLVRKIPYKQIQFFKNDTIKSEISISLIEKLETQTYLFPDTPIIFDKNDKIEMKLV